MADSVFTGRTTQAQSDIPDEQRVLAFECLARHGALDLAEMLGVVSA